MSRYTIVPRRRTDLVRKIVAEFDATARVMRLSGVPVTVKSLRGLGISVLRDGPACAPQIVQLACSGCRHGY